MRIAIVVLAGAALTLAAAAPAKACFENVQATYRPLAEGVVAAAAGTDLSAKKHHKMLRKHKKKKKEKGEYMRAVPAK